MKGLSETLTGEWGGESGLLLEAMEEDQDEARQFSQTRNER
jgi:hypothetical protein